MPFAVKDGKDPSSGSSGSSMQTLVLTEGMVLGGGAFSRVSVATGELVGQWLGVVHNYCNGS